MIFLGSKWMDLVLPWAEAAADSTALDSMRQKVIREASEGVKSADLKSLEKFQEGISFLLQSDEERRISVDGRLAMMVGLASIAATLVTGILVAQASGTLKIGSPVRWVIASIVVYLVLQLCDAICWAIYGLQRKNYSSLTIQNFLPQPALSEEERLREEIVSRIEMLHDNREATNEKVTAMAVAHRSAMNFAVGLLVLAVAGMLALPFTPLRNTAPNTPKSNVTSPKPQRSQGLPGSAKDAQEPRASAQSDARSGGH